MSCTGIYQRVGSEKYLIKVSDDTIKNYKDYVGTSIENQKPEIWNRV